MPGKSVGTENPLILIDEIDKLGRCHTGNPVSALLEVMDPEQNANFLDHFLNVTIDLSKVLFVCTTNVIEMILSPLLDRMEVIDLSGYVTDEKMHIARDYLVKTTCRDFYERYHFQVDVSDAALLSLRENYCREAGLRRFTVRGDVEAQLSPILRSMDSRWICMRSFIVDAEIAELFFVDTTPFVDAYFLNPQDQTYDWSGVSPRE
ncbi:ATPase AAA-type core [Arabidopsis suecica]|uniref:ATPase AAA-type core n=1 Tax=Arabidopsis suecica TaxID=45249 RepID=A0A8T1ZGK2_ARASU|nr:ATPase AAA-type core [Arabidopsis suecica]